MNPSSTRQAPLMTLFNTIIQNSIQGVHVAEQIALFRLAKEKIVDFLIVMK